MFAPIMSVGTLPGILGGTTIMLITNYLILKKKLCKYSEISY